MQLQIYFKNGEVIVTESFESKFEDVALPVEVGKEDWIRTKDSLIRLDEVAAIRKVK